MLREEVVDKIIRRTFGNDMQVRIFQDYLLDNTETMPAPGSLDHIYIYFSSIPFDRTDSVEVDVFKRAYQMLSTVNPTMMIERVQHSGRTYDLFHLFELPESFVERHIVYIMKEYIQYNNVTQHYERLQWIAESFMIHYPQLTEKLLNGLATCSKGKQEAAIILLTYKAKEEKGEYLKELEQVYYSILKKLYSKGELQREWKNCQQTEESERFLQEHKEIPISIQQNVLGNLAFLINTIAFGLSPKLNDAMRVSIALQPINKLVQKFCDYKTELNYLEERCLPLSTHLKFYAYWMSVIYRQEKDKSIYQELEEIYQKDLQAFFDTIKAFMAKKNVQCGVLIAFLLKKEVPEAKEFLPEFENILIKEIVSYQSNNNQRILEIDPNVDIQGFECLRKSDFDASCISGDIYMYSTSMSEVCMSSIFLAGYSVVAVNIVKIMARVLGYSLGHVKMTTAMQLFLPVMKKGFFDCIHDDLGFSLEEITHIVLAERKTGVIDTNTDNQFLEFITQYKKEAEEGLQNFHLDTDELQLYMKLLYEDSQCFDYCALEHVFYIKSKAAANYAEKLLMDKESMARPFVEEMKNAKSKLASDAALRLIRLWDNDKIDKELEQIKDIPALTEYIQGMYTKSNDKNTPYAKEIDYSQVRGADSEEYLPEVLIKYYISEYILLKDLYYVKTCKKIQDMANIYDVRALVKKVYELWISEGASTKYKNLLLPFALCAGESQIAELKKQIDDWADNSKPALAAFAVQALCMNGSKMALLMANTMSKKHKSKKVKAAATEAMTIAAKEMGITNEELNDMIVPDLNFDKNRKRIFDYGKRKFICTLNDKLEVTLTDETGKTIKSLPKASAKFEDNEDMAENAKETLKTVKKQLKVVLDSQKPRMFHAVLTGRTWTVQKWKELFVDNPIMLPFATGLVWEEMDKDKTILQTFRYMDDGTLNTADEEEHTLQENSIIGLLHPTDVSQELVDEWKQQLEDYDIIQPVQQLSIPIYEIEESQMNSTELTMFEGKKIYGATLKSTANKLGIPLYFDSYGECSGCMYTDDTYHIIMVLHTDSFYLGDYSTVVKVGNITFSSVDSGAGLKLSHVPKKLLSMAVFVGDSVTVKTVQE